MNLAKTKNGEIINLQFAQKVIKENCKIERNYKGEEFVKIFKGLSTSKLRGLLDYITRIYTKVYNSSNVELSDDICDELEYLKVKFAYESSKEESVSLFIKKTHVSSIIDIVIKDKTKKFFFDYCKYFEALVAYAKFYGKED